MALVSKKGNQQRNSDDTISIADGVTSSNAVALGQMTSAIAAAVVVPGGSSGQVQLNASSAFAGQTTTNHMQWFFNDSTRVATYLDSGGTYISIDGANGICTFGNVAGSGNNTTLTINDAGKAISLFAQTTIAQQSNSIQWTGTIVYGSTQVVTYGSTNTITFPDGAYTFAVSGSSGATTFNLPTSGGVPLGTTYVFKDLGLAAVTSNITIDVGTGKVIVGTTSAQTYVINTAGQSVTVTKVSSTQWAII